MIPAGGHSGRAPSVTLPLAYLATAATAFVLAALALPGLSAALAGHYYHPRLLALTHVVTLGWITLAIMGASYQLIPVVIERPLFSERLARWQLPVLAAGIIGMVATSGSGRWDGLAWAAALVGAGILAHVINVALSLRGLARWSFTARGVALALGGLALTVAFGVTLAITHGARVFPGGPLGAVHAHFHLALLGWIAPMILAVAARVYPDVPPRAGAGRLGRLRPARGPGPRRARRWRWGSRSAGPRSWWRAPSRSRWRSGSTCGGSRALPGGGSGRPSTGDCASSSPARRASCRREVLGLAFALGLGSGPRAALAYAVLALGGWVSLTIVGMMLKIVPFLVWYRVYAPRAGREPVPTLAQLSWPAGERLAYGLLTAGTLALAATVAAGEPAAIAVAGAIVGVGALAFAAALGRTLWHLRPCVAGRHAPALPARP